MSDVQRYMKGSVVPAHVNVLNDQRVGAADRARVTDHLSQMYADDRLSDEEFHARLAAIHEVKTTTELRDLTRDLPSLPEPPKPWRARHERFVIASITAGGVITSVAIATLPGMALGGFNSHPSVPVAVLTVALVILGLIGCICSLVAGIGTYAETFD